MRKTLSILMSMLLLLSAFIGCGSSANIPASSSGSDTSDSLVTEKDDEATSSENVNIPS